MPSQASTVPPGEPLDIDRLMREIRADIASRLPDSALDVESGRQRRATAAVEEGSRLGRIGDFSAPLARKPQYRLDELLAFHDEDFVRNAYLALLGREPDAEGATRYLARIRSGDLSRIEVLGRIRWSPEGKERAVRVEGLRVPFALRTVRRVPMLGRLLGIIQYVWRLPDVVRNHDVLESALFAIRTDTRARVNAIVDDVEQALARLHADLAAHATRLAVTDENAGRDARRLDALALALATKAEQAGVESTRAALQIQIEALGRTLATKVEQTEAARMTTELQTNIARMGTELQAAITKAQRDADALRDTNQELGQRIARIAPAAELASLVTTTERAYRDLRRLAQAVGREAASDERAALPAPAPTTGVPRQIEGAAAMPAFSEGFYVAFEDRFRGTREDIRSRVEVYLPYVGAAGAGSAHAPVLDLGCGRGEWIELLRDQGLVAYGVDSNEVAVAGCRARGLEVVRADALAHLRRLADRTIGSVTALHVIEHLPFAQVVELFDEARRVLIPGGVVIFETPNPENLVVGACGFYYDPTHLRPLPPEPSRFVLASRGFARVEIMRLHPDPRGSELGDTSSTLARTVAERLFGPQDYALIGWK